MKHPVHSRQIGLLKAFVKLQIETFHKMEFVVNCYLFPKLSIQIRSLYEMQVKSNSLLNLTPMIFTLSKHKVYNLLNQHKKGLVPRDLLRIEFTAK